MIKLLNAIVGVFIRKRHVDSWRGQKIERSRKEFRADAKKYP